MFHYMASVVRMCLFLATPFVRALSFILILPVLPSLMFPFLRIYQHFNSVVKQHLFNTEYLLVPHISAVYASPSFTKWIRLLILSAQPTLFLRSVTGYSTSGSCSNSPAGFICPSL